MLISVIFGNFKSVKGRGTWEMYSEFILYIFSLGGIKTHDMIFKIFINQARAVAGARLVS